MSADDGAVGFPYLRRRGPLALIGLSTAVPTPPFMATGRLGEAQLARLAETLVALAREKLFRVVLIHHPPVSEAKRHKRLTDAGANSCASSPCTAPSWCCTATITCT